MERSKADISLIWRHTHPDYRGRIDGKRSILVNRNGGTQSVPIESLTDSEWSGYLGAAQRREKNGQKPYR